MSNTTCQITRSIRRNIAVGAGVLIFLFAGLGAWAATSELAGAIVSPGVLMVDSTVKKIQHPTGGIVSEILVRDSTKVKAGDLLVRLDDTITRANFAISEKTLDELAARQARLRAERDDRVEIVFPQELLSRKALPQIADIIDEETKLFTIRRATREGQKAQLRERIGQISEELIGLSGQASAKENEVELINRELSGVRDLWEKRLIPITRLVLLEREAVRLGGERGQLMATSAQARGKIIETRLQIAQIDQDMKSEGAKELREIQAKTAELIERKIAAQDQLTRIDIRAPIDGTVHQLSVHTIGGVIASTDILMLIVPSKDALIVELRAAPQSIDQLAPGQNAFLRFSAFNMRTTPEIQGEVQMVSADISTDQKSGTSYYVARVVISADELAKLGEVKLVPGMPVEAYIRTQQRTVLSYLVKPLSDQIMRAFRER